MSEPTKEDREAARWLLACNGEITFMEKVITALENIADEPYMAAHRASAVAICDSSAKEIDRRIDEQSEIEMRERLEQEREDKSFTRTHRAGPGGI